MKTRLWGWPCFVLLGASFTIAADEPAKTKKAGKETDLIAHIVYFTLKESTPEARQKLVDSCDKYLSKHDDTVFYSAGVVAEDFDRSVNVRDFDVALHLIFKNKAAHDKYQTHPRHLQFIKENKETFKQVRVHDARIAKK